MKKSAMFFCLIVGLSLRASDKTSYYPINLTSARWQDYKIVELDYALHAVDFCFQGGVVNNDNWVKAQQRVKDTINYVMQEVSFDGYVKGYADASLKGLLSDQNLVKIILTRADDSRLQYGIGGSIVALFLVYGGYKFVSDVVLPRFRKKK